MEVHCNQSAQNKVRAGKRNLRGELARLSLFGQGGSIHKMLKMGRLAPLFRLAKLGSWVKFG